MSTNIYQRLWDNDENQFSVSARTASGEWENENADILLDEQVTSSGSRNIDLATKPLFYRVNEDKLFDESRTYVSFIQLLDNYALNCLDPESTPEQELGEQHTFLSLIMGTKPIKLALQYINEQFGENISEEKFRSKLQRIWFELYNNYYKGKSTTYCSGFEHIFVGEGKYNPRFDDKCETLGEISGYHSWVKFYLDEKNQRVNFLGYKYDLHGNQGLHNPNVVTLQMTQTITDMRGNIVAQLFKKKGGFFVGPSPECEIAIATVLYYESLHGKIQDQRSTTLNNENYKLTLYRNINPNGSRGEFIRSFFPIYVGNQTSEEPQMDRPVVVPIDRILRNGNPVKIISALPNPEGQDDQGQEWVELRNETDTAIDLTGWELRDKQGRPQKLQVILQPQMAQRIMITPNHPNAMQLSNRSGLIALYDRDFQLISAVQYRRANPGTLIQFEENTH